MEIEITEDLHLMEEQENMLMMHSFINIMGVLTTELQILEKKFSMNGDIKEVIHEAFERSKSFTRPVSGLKYADELIIFEEKVLNAIDRALKAHPEGAVNKENVELVENIGNILSVLKVHAREIIARNGEKEKWLRHKCKEIREGLVRFLSAVEKNSKGRYRIVYNIANQGPGDYMVDLNIGSVDGPEIRIPAVFQDIMRDMIANSRKYTSAGGMISAGMYDDGEMVRMVVEDTGRGIPEDEIESIVRFSTRASNVGPHETHGAGFGLTKAYFVTRQFNGRMWIRSAPGDGTRITIHVPRPPGSMFSFTL